MLKFRQNTDTDGQSLDHVQIMQFVYETYLRHVYIFSKLITG